MSDQVHQTTPEEIRRWLLRAKAAGATHMIVVYDMFDHKDYPVHIMPGEDVKEKHDNYVKTFADCLQRVMEVYALHLDLESQLLEHRAFHFEQAPIIDGKQDYVVLRLPSNDRATEADFARKEAIAYAEVIKHRTAPMPVLMVVSLIEKAFLAGWDAAKKRKE